MAKIEKSEKEWERLLTLEQYRICREKGTERAFTGEYWETKTSGIYKCVCCGNPLFDANSKFNSGTGWPSYTEPVNQKNIKTESDNRLGMSRTEVMCQDCGAHLGHVFSDGPGPKGQRYCINSVSLKLEKDS